MATPPDLADDERVVDDGDARIRLLICFVCDSIDPLPWFDGPPEHDETLNARLRQHRTPEGHPHIGNLATVSETSWNNPDRRERVIAELSKVREGGETGLGSKFYDVRDTYEEQSMQCWRVKHGRRENCEDYRSDKMRLLADTRDERKDLRLSTKARDRPGGTYLCSFCPVESIIQQRKNRAKGYYDGGVV